MTTQKQLEESQKTTEDAPPVVENPGLNVTRQVVDEDGDGKQDPTGPRLTVGVYEVLIERSNQAKIATEVFGYEIPVLKVVHGEQSITFPGYPDAADAEDAEPAYEVEIDNDAHAILQTLRQKYNNPQSGDPVGAVYRDAGELSQKTGIAKPKGKARQAPQSESVDNRKKPAKK